MDEAASKPGSQSISRAISRAAALSPLRAESGAESVALSPYREAAPRRFVCLACCREFDLSGECPTCAVPLLDVAVPAVRDQIDFEREHRLQRRQLREEGPLFLLSMILVAPVLFWLAVPFTFWLALVLAFPVEKVLRLGYAKLFPNSAVATYIERRRQLTRELGVDANVDP